MKIQSNISKKKMKLKTRLKIFNLLLTILIITFYSCDKGDSTKRKTDLLTKSTWFHNYEMLDLNHNEIPDDVIGQIKDIKMKFNSDGSLVYTFNQEVFYLSWKFNENESSIIVTGNFNSGTHKIYELDGGTLIFYYNSLPNNAGIVIYQFYIH